MKDTKYLLILSLIELPVQGQVMFFEVGFSGENGDISLKKLCLPMIVCLKGQFFLLLLLQQGVLFVRFRSFCILGWNQGIRYTMVRSICCKIN